MKKITRTHVRLGKELLVPLGLGVRLTVNLLKDKEGPTGPIS